MKSSLTIKNRLFFTITAILACSYAILFVVFIFTIQHVIEEESAKDLEHSLRYAKNQFNARQETVLEVLKLSASTNAIQQLFKAADHDGLRELSQLWTKSLDLVAMVTIFDAEQKVIARNNRHNEKESFLQGDLLNFLYERKQPLITTELVSHENYCREVGSDVCQSLADNSDVMLQLVMVPVMDISGNVLGVIAVGDDVNKDPHLPYQQKKVFGKTIDMFVTQMGERIASTMTGLEGVTVTLEPKVLQALKSGFSFHGATLLNRQPCEMIAEPIYNHKGEFIGSIAVAIGNSKFSSMRNDNFANLIICGFLSITIIAALAYFISRQFVLPIRRFSEAINSIESGDYSTKIPENGSSEFIRVAEAFNRMTVAVSDRDSRLSNQNFELAALNEELEKKVSATVRCLENETAVKNSIIKSVIDGLVVADEHCRVIVLNQAAEKLFGMTAVDMVGEPLLKLCAQLGFTEMGAFLQKNVAADLAEDEASVVLKHKRRSLRLVVTVLKGEAGLRRGVLLAIRDVTNDCEIDRLKSGFIAKVSHELKTPLTSMKGSLQFILKKGKWLTGMEREMLGVCLRNTDRLIDLVVSILELSRIEAGQILFSMKSLQISEVVLYALEEIKGSALQRNISIVNDVPMDLPEIYGDYERLIQVLSNLLLNAVEYSSEHSVITLSAVIENAFLALSVGDDAKVITEEQREQLFSSFQQIGLPEDGQFCGSGLGLAISKEIVERHGGSICHAQSATGGNVYTFTLPLYGEKHGRR